MVLQEDNLGYEMQSFFILSGNTRSYLMHLQNNGCRMIIQGMFPWREQRRERKREERKIGNFLSKKFLPKLGRKLERNMLLLLPLPVYLHLFPNVCPSCPHQVGQCYAAQSHPLFVAVREHILFSCELPHVGLACKLACSRRTLTTSSLARDPLNARELVSPPTPVM